MTRYPGLIGSLMLLVLVGIILVVSVTVSSSTSGITCTDYESDDYGNNVTVIAEIKGDASRPR